MRLIYLSFVAALLFSVNSFANDNDFLTTRIDSLLLDYKDAPGCILGIAKDGQLLFTKSYGYSNLDYNIPFSDSTVFNIASISKQFTAACAALLVQEGKMDLNAEIQDYLPTFKKFEHPVKIKDLIYHRSGLWTYEMVLFIGSFDRGSHINNDWVMEMLNEQDSLIIKPGSKFAYSNSNYIVLAEIIEEITGQNLADFSREKLFDPCGMDDTFIYDERERVVKNRAVGYDTLQGEFKRYLDNSVIYGEAGVYTTVKDLAKWNDFLFNEKIGKNGFLDLMLKKEMLPDSSLHHYTFGIYEKKYKGNTYIGHAGYIYGFCSNLLYFPDEDKSLILFSNSPFFQLYAMTDKVMDLILKDKRDEEEKSDKTKTLKPAKKKALETIELNPDVLGKYRWDYCNVTYSVDFIDDVCKIKMGEMDWTELIFIEKDKASTNCSGLPFEIQFLRNEEAVVNAIAVKAPRAVKVKFEKIN